MTAKRPSPAKSFRFTPEEQALLDRLAEEHGSQKAAIMAGLDALVNRREITDAQLARLVTARLTGKRAR